MTTTNVTKDNIEVKSGQVWVDLDIRMRGRRVTVLSVQDGKAHVQGVRATTLSVRRMHRHSTGWKLLVP